MSQAQQSNPSTPNRLDEIAERIEFDMSQVLVRGAVYELRALGLTLPGDPARRVLSGYFDDVAELARTAARLDGHARGIYVTLNPLRPELLDRAPNRLDPQAAAAGDADVLRRRWLPLDFDPVRPANTNATEDELALAYERADRAWNWLRGQGWPEPRAALSGNGWHLLFPIDLPPERGGHVQRTLKALSGRFTDAEVRLDPVVHNPSRIWKVYGTVAAKGPHTRDRPRRRAILLGSGCAARR